MNGQLPAPASAKIECRGYQTASIDAAREKIAGGCRAPLIVLPVGTGKTTVGAEIARSHEAQGGTVLWMAHLGELVKQAEERLRLFGVRADVQTVQTLAAAMSRGEALREYSLVLFDEAHHYAADSYRLVADRHRKAVRVGLTATPQRGDGRGLGSVFDCIVAVAGDKELTAAGYLSPLEIICPPKRLDPGELAKPPAEAYLTHCPDELALVFAPTIEDARRIQGEFEAAGVPAGIVHGTLPAPTRARVLKEHASKKIKVLINVFLLGEGYDCPEISACIIARGVSTPSALVQMSGRARRPFPSKSRALLIDLPGVTHVLGAPDEEYEYSLDGAGMVSKSGPRFCAVCAALIPEDYQGACPECGASAQNFERKPMKVVDVELSRFIPDNFSDAPQRATQLAELVRVGYVNGYKPGWARRRFRQDTGFWPTKKMIDLAERLARS